MLDLLKKHKALFISIVLYLLAVFLVSPFGEFAVNDDWDFITHVRNFRQGDFIKNSLIDSAFILQGVLGVIWTYIFGLSFTALKVLTIVITIIFIVGVYKTLHLLKTSPVFTLLTIIFNPLIFPFSLTFMTELYFLCFMIWGIYFLLLYADTRLYKHLIFSTLLLSACTLIRQLGLLLLPALIISLLIINKKSNYIKNIIVPSFIFITFLLISLLWPQYNADNERPFDLLTAAATNIENISATPYTLYKLIPYIGLSLLPFVFSLFIKLDKKYKLLSCILVAVSFFSFYNLDVFSIGNNLFIEGLLAKNNYVQHITLFDNTLAKSILCVGVLLAGYSGLLFALQNRKNFQFQQHLLLIFIAFLLFPVAAYGTSWDRYYINALVLTVIVVGTLLGDIKKYLVYFPLSIFILFTLILSQDFFVTTKTLWRHAALLKTQVKVDNRIYLSSTYSKYNSIYFKENSPSIDKAMPQGISYQCYIQKKPVADKSHPVYAFLSRITTSATINKFISNPQIYDNKLLPGYRPPTFDHSKIKTEQEVHSMLYTPLGYRLYITTYCEY